MNILLLEQQSVIIRNFLIFSLLAKIHLEAHLNYIFLNTCKSSSDKDPESYPLTINKFHPTPFCVASSQKEYCPPNPL